MATTYSPSLGLALPTTGELSGTWGDTVNNYITTFIDTAVAGTLTLSTDADVTLTKTEGSALGSTSSQYAIIRWTASNGATTRNITAPAISKSYLVINAGTGSIVVRGAGPTAGVTVVSGERCVVAWSGADFTKVSSNFASTLSGVLAPANGGTGVANGSNNTITFSGNFTLGLTLTGNTSVTLPTSGTIATKGNAIAFSIVFGL